MKRTFGLAALLVGALALTTSSSVQAQHHWGPGHSKRGKNHMSFSFGMHQGRLGAQVTSMTPSLRKHFGAPADSGLLVGKVQGLSAAAKAGLAVGDVIIKVDGKKVVQPWDVMTALASKKQGDKVVIEIVRSKRIMTLQATMKSHGWGMPNVHMYTKQFSKTFGKNFGKTFGKTWGKNLNKHLGKDFDLLMKGLQNGRFDINALRNWAANGKGDLAKKLRETMKRVFELEKALKKLQKTK